MVWVCRRHSGVGPPDTVESPSNALIKSYKSMNTKEFQISHKYNVPSSPAAALRAVGVALICMIGAGLSMPSAEAATLKVIVEGVENTDGKMRLSLFATEDTWLKEGVRMEILPLVMPEMVWDVMDLKPGVYAVSAVHDCDANGELNTGTFGMPTEPYGFSNNARNPFGPAKWKDACFEVVEGENTIRFQVR